MVKEKEAFIVNLLKAIDSIIIILSFLLSYFIDDFIRTAYDFGEIAYAIAPTFKGFL